MSIITKIFKKEEKEKEEYYAGEDALAQLGINIYKMETHSERIEQIAPLIEELKKIEDPDTLINILVEITDLVIAPYLRAGSEPRIAELLKHYYWLLNSWYRKLLRIVSELDVSEEKKKTYRRIILCAIKEEFLPLTEIVWSISFREEDIVPKIVNIIHTYQEPGVVPTPSVFEHYLKALMDKNKG